MHVQLKKGQQTQTTTQPFFSGKRKRVGLLGGNFNPVHTAHLIIADQVYHQLGLDEVYLLPSFLPPHVDEKQTIQAEQRLDMLELATADNDALKIERLELIRQGKSYTYDTICALKEMHPETDYYFIIGGDMVEYLHKWHRITELLELVQFIGVKRPNYPQESPYPIIWVDVPLMEISSSLIRQKIREGCSVQYLLPKNVIEYIYQKELYGHDSTRGHKL